MTSQQQLAEQHTSTPESQTLLHPAKGTIADFMSTAKSLLLDPSSEPALRNSSTARCAAADTCCIPQNAGTAQPCYTVSPGGAASAKHTAKGMCSQPQLQQQW